MIKAIIFDIDGVLIDSLEANHKFFSNLLEKHGYGFITKEEYISLFHMPMKDIIRFSTNSTDEEEIEKIWKSGKDREVPYPDELINASEELEEIIESLSKNYILGIVTGRVRSSIYSIPQIKNLKEQFKIDVSYEDTKEHKPHPAPLLLAAEKLGVFPKECVYIGDSEIDMLAAKAAGMKSIIYSQNKILGADISTSSFEKLPEIIKSISKNSQ